MAAAQSGCSAGRSESGKDVGSSVKERTQLS